MQFTHDEITASHRMNGLALIARLWDSLEDHQVQLTSAHVDCR
jgi:hypothetical protein